ncbi:UrcA family protein [Sphingosinicella microcystinivorans]|uniref:UrcA family protein n=1 Tax=Sphingosinicella microcystinivorans TaxID=335406 RepID=UPI0022F4080A|nr:UrcA family protein [Sphingosinicella microcystinivorans]WBX82953.1 UrcA family protein [Sphingosinicella microcystinivorans]
MKTLLALSALAGGLWALPATAEPVSPEATRVVSYGDLDLATADGRRALDSRIRIAVRSACGTASAADLVGKREVRRCRETARADIAPVSERILTAALEGGPTRPPTR